MQRMTVAAVSMTVSEKRPKDNLENIAKWARKGASQNAELMVFPELAVSGCHKNSESVPGPSTEALAQIAGDLNALLCVGISELCDDVTFNSQLVISGNGVIGKQRKLHIPDGESPNCSGGEVPEAIDIGKAKVGITICYDAFFSEVARCLYMDGAQILIMPYKESNSPPRSQAPEDAMYLLAARVSCWANGCYGVVANWSGTPDKHEPKPRYGSWPGWAGIFGPQGNIIEFTRGDGNSDAMVVACLDPDALAQCRKHPAFTASRLRQDVIDRLKI